MPLGKGVAMSLAIDIDDVRGVLLVDGWHEVEERTFRLDFYEYVEGKSDPELPVQLVHSGGQSGVCETGFSFREPNVDVPKSRWTQIEGPLTTILAVRTEAQS
jgi:hypothetical protein